MHRIRTAAGLLLASLFLWGCGENEAAEGMAGQVSKLTAIEVMKDGSIVETITEDFDKDYYDEETLKNMVLGEIAEYNKTSGNAGISIEKFENKKEKLTVRMKYPSAEVYTSYNTDEYNEMFLFNGTVAQAYDAGQSFDITLKDIKGENTVGKDELLAMGDAKLLIATMPVHVKVPGKILYISENMTADGKSEADMQPDENGEASGTYYVVFQ